MARLRSSFDIVLDNTRASVATLPFRMNDSGGRNGYARGYANTLIESATTNTDRESVPSVDYDFHNVVSAQGRRTLMKLGRAMFWKVPALMAAILEQANLASSPFTPLFLGKDKAWGEEAASWLNNWHQVMCSDGWPYDYDTYTEQLISAPIVDGMIHTILTQDTSGNPRVQLIPAHRIGRRGVSTGIAKVTYSGLTLAIDGVLIDETLPWTFDGVYEFDALITDGVIVDGQNRPIAYRIYGDGWTESYRDLSARSCFPCFFPLVPGQVTGVSLLASSVFDWQDWREWKRFEQLAHKGFATKGIVETNETGEADSAKALVQTVATFNADNTKKTLDTEKLEGGTITYFRARSGSKLEAFNWGDRPGANSQEFMESTVRDAFRGTEWDKFFSLDPAHVGGAPMRVIVDRINRVLKKRRRVLRKQVLRTDIYGLAKAIKNGDVPFNPDWFKWTYQGPADLTADRRYDAQTDEMEYALGWSTLEDIEARRNGDWLQKREQRQREVDDLYTRARAISDKHGIPIQEAAAQMSRMGNQYLNFGEQVADADKKDELRATDSQGAPVNVNE